MRLFLFALLATLFVMTATPASAQLAVVDMQQILSDSAAAKSILAQLKDQRAAIEKDIKGMEEGLKKDEQALIKKKEGAKPEEFAAARKEFEKKLIESRTKVQKRRHAADEAFNKAISELRENIVTVVSDIAAEKKIQLVITKQNVVIGDKSLEITDEVMKALNAKVKTIKVKI